MIKKILCLVMLTSQVLQSSDGLPAVESSPMIEQPRLFWRRRLAPLLTCPRSAVQKIDEFLHGVRQDILYKCSVEELSKVLNGKVVGWKILYGFNDWSSPPRLCMRVQYDLTRSGQNIVVQEDALFCVEDGKINFVRCSQDLHKGLQERHFGRYLKPNLNDTSLLRLGEGYFGMGMFQRSTMHYAQLWNRKQSAIECAILNLMKPDRDTKCQTTTNNGNNQQARLAVNTNAAVVEADVVPNVKEL